MLHSMPLPSAGSDPLNQLDQLVQRVQRKLGDVNPSGPAPAAAAAEAPDMDFADPAVLGQFLGQVAAAPDNASPFSHHALDPDRVARLLAED